MYQGQDIRQYVKLKVLGGTGNPNFSILIMNKHDLRYREVYVCFYCKRIEGVDKSIHHTPGKPLVITKDHIISKHYGGQNDPENYIAACQDCNHLKDFRDVRRFAKWLGNRIKDGKYRKHPMHKFFFLMKFNAWKLYNKKSFLYKRCPKFNYINKYNFDTTPKIF